MSLASLLWSIQSSFVNASAAHHQDITTWYVIFTSNLYDFCNKLSNNRMQMLQQIKTQKTDPESESGSQAFSDFWIKSYGARREKTMPVIIIGYKAVQRNTKDSILGTCQTDYSRMIWKAIGQFCRFTRTVILICLNQFLCICFVNFMSLTMISTF